MFCWIYLSDFWDIQISDFSKTHVLAFYLTSGTFHFFSKTIKRMIRVKAQPWTAEEKWMAIMNNPSHFLPNTLDWLKSSLSNRLIQCNCSRKQHRKRLYLSAIPPVIIRLDHLSIYIKTMIMHMNYIYLSSPPPPDCVNKYPTVMFNIDQTFIILTYICEGGVIG